MGSVKRNVRPELAELKSLARASEREDEDEHQQDHTEKKTNRYLDANTNDYAYFVKILASASIASTPKGFGNEVKLGIMQIMDTPDTQEKGSRENLILISRLHSSQGQVDVHLFYNRDMVIGTGMGNTIALVPLSGASNDYVQMTGKSLAEEISVKELKRD